MIDPPSLCDLAPLLYAGLRLTIPKDAIQREMGPGLRAVHAALAEQGVAPAGPWFTQHFRLAPDVWDFEIGVPVARPIAPIGAVAPRSHPALRVARTSLRGGYEGLAAGWGAFDAWAAGQGLALREDRIEVYTVGPESGLGPRDWRTDLRRPLAST